MRAWIFGALALFLPGVTCAQLTIDEPLQLFPSFGETSPPALSFAPLYTITPASGPIDHWSLTPTLIVDDATPFVHDLHIGGSVTQRVNASWPGLYRLSSIWLDKTFRSTTDGVAPTFPDTVVDAYTVEYAAPNGAAVSPWLPISFVAFGTMRASAGADFVSGPVTGFYSQQYVQADGAGSNFTTAIRAAYTAADIVPSETNGGNVDVGINAGFYSGPLIHGNDPRSFYSQGSAPMVQAGPARFGTDARPRGGSTLDVDGGLTVKRTSISSHYAASLDDYVIASTWPCVARTVTLPAAAAAQPGKVYVVKDEGACANPYDLTVVSAGGTIDGAASKKITQDYGLMRLYSSGTAWFTW